MWERREALARFVELFFKNASNACEANTLQTVQMNAGMCIQVAATILAVQELFAKHVQWDFPVATPSATNPVPLLAHGTRLVLVKEGA